VIPSTYELHDKYTLLARELHVGVTLPRIEDMVAPQIFAMVTSINDVHSTLSARLAIGAQF
jgi:hypothetical protein